QHAVLAWLVRARRPRQLYARGPRLWRSPRAIRYSLDRLLCKSSIECSVNRSTAFIVVLRERCHRRSRFLSNGCCNKPRERTGCGRTLSIVLRDSRFGNDVAILHDLVAEEFFGSLERHVNGLGALLGKPRTHRRILNRRFELAVEPGRDRWRRAVWRQ